MGTEASARQAKESLELAFQMSQILDTGLDRHTLSLLMAFCDRGANPEALAALVRELSSSSAPPDFCPHADPDGLVAVPLQISPALARVIYSVHGARDLGELEEQTNKG